MSRKNIGNFGEDLAEAYLKKRGYQIIDRNWYCRGGEIDLICLDKKLVFVEVKYVNGDFCSPYDQLTYFKLSKLLRAIRKYLEMYPKYTNNWRLDLVAIQRIGNKNTISHHKSINFIL